MVHPRDDGDLRPELGLIAADAVQLLHSHGAPVGQLAAVHGPIRALVDHVREILGHGLELRV
jgi:hypothetical protein